jgi:hypothetical protein
MKAAPGPCGVHWESKHGKSYSDRICRIAWLTDNLGNTVRTSDFSHRTEDFLAEQGNLGRAVYGGLQHYLAPTVEEHANGRMD